MSPLWICPIDEKQEAGFPIENEKYLEFYTVQFQSPIIRFAFTALTFLRWTHFLLSNPYSFVDFLDITTSYTLLRWTQCSRFR